MTTEDIRERPMGRDELYEFLQMLGQGDALDDLAEHIDEAAQATMDVQKKASITLKLTVDTPGRDRMGSVPLEWSWKITASIPTFDMPPTILYRDADGRMLRTRPNQGILPAFESEFSIVNNRRSDADEESDT